MIGVLRGDGLGVALLSGISLAIAAIPEEFPLIFTLYLTIGAWQLARRNALVRRMVGVESLGSTTVVCADKTGTLTQGRLTVEALWADGARHDGRPADVNNAERRLLTAAIFASEPEPIDPLDLAIFAVARDVGLRPYEITFGWELVRDYPFDSHRRYLSHVWRSPTGRLVIRAKGSPEGILSLAAVSPAERQAVVEANERLTSEGMRVLAVAEKPLSRLTGSRASDETGVQLVGLIGFSDPPRAGVPAAVDECQRAGVRIVMITGDHPLTAHAVAEEIGIRHDDEEILTGADLARLDADGLRERAHTVAVFARIEPVQKLQIVRALQAAGEIVAMTGDGVNDAPALRAADVGVAMGHRGTEVAREAATMVLLDDDFGTIAAAIREGRRIYDNLRKAFDYLIGFHVPIVFTALLVPLFGLPLLLLPIHLVWLELIIHPTSALVYQAEPPAGDLMQRPPRDPRAPFLSRGAGLLYAGIGAAITAGALVLYVGSLAFGDAVEHARTLTLALFLIAQSILTLQARSTRRRVWGQSLTENRVLLPVIVGAIVSLVILMYVPPLAAATLLEPIHATDWLIAIAVAALCTLPFEFLKPIR